MIGKKVLITGASGMVGGIVLKHCINADEVGEVISIGRKSLGISSEKVTEIIHSDFENYSGLEQVFSDVDAAYFCIGVYTGAVPDNVFKQITVDYTRAFGDMLSINSPKANVVFLSGNGADTTEQSKVAFAKYKGMAENHLQSFDFGNLTILRPSYIYPVEKRYEPNLMYRVSRALYPLIKMLGTQLSITSNQLGLVMFKCGIMPPQESVLENAQIIDYVNSK